jgi:hypothetical protein
VARSTKPTPPPPKHTLQTISPILRKSFPRATPPVGSYKNTSCRFILLQGNGPSGFLIISLFDRPENQLSLHGSGASYRPHRFHTLQEGET